MHSTVAKISSPDLFERGLYLFFLGKFQRFSGDTAGARGSYQQSRDAIETLSHQEVDSTGLHALRLAVVDMGLGEKDEAIRQAEVAVEKFPATKDAYAGPNYEEWLARALARFGEKDRALEILQHLLVTSYADPITTALLRVDPYWDNLRGDPRFEKLCQEAAK